MDKRPLKSAFLSIALALCVCRGCDSAVGGATFVLCDPDTQEVIRCPKCAGKELL